VIFRANDFAAAGRILYAMSGLRGFSGGFEQTGLLVVCALVSMLLPSAHHLKDDVLRPNLALAAGAAVLAIVCIFVAGGGSPINFIYFQF
jgi:hypothetical protein